MTMKDYAAAAQHAHDDLLPLLDAAVVDAQDRLTKAKHDASAESLRPDLVALLDNADTPPADAVGGIIATYAALLNNPASRDGAWMIRSLASTVKHHGLSDEQARQIAGAMIASIHGQAPVSLIQWPAADGWHDGLLHDADLKKWASWVAPKNYEKLSTGLDATTQKRINAEMDLAQLETSRQALAALVPEPAMDAVVSIRNNASNRQGIAGINWDGGEVKRLDAADYTTVTQHPAFHRLIEQKQLEVVA